MKNTPQTITLAQSDGYVEHGRHGSGMYGLNLDDLPHQDNSVQAQAVELLSMFKRHKLLFLVVFVGLFATGAAVVLSEPASFSAVTSVLFDPRNRQIVNFTPVVSAFDTEGQTLEVEVATELQLILSRRVVDPVIEHFDLMHDPEFNKTSPGRLQSAFTSTKYLLLTLVSRYTGAAPPAVPATPQLAGSMHQVVLKAFADHASVRLQGHSTVIEVSFTSRDPEKAAKIANAIAENYVRLSVADKTAAAQEALNTLTRRSAELQAQSIAADRAVDDYRTSAHLIEGAGGTVISGQVSSYNAQLVQAQADLADAKARFLPGGPAESSTASMPAALASPVVQKLREQEVAASAVLAQTQTRQGDNYPGVAALKSSLSAVRTQINAEIANIIRGQRIAVDAAQTRVDLLAAKLATSEQQAAVNGSADVQLRQLKLEADVQHALYESYLRRIQEVSQQVGTAQPYAEVISAAERSEKPSSPNLKLLLPGIFLVSAALASANVICAELLGRSFSSSRQIAQVFGSTPVEMLPRLRGWRMSGRSHDHTSDPYSEAIHALRVRLHAVHTGASAVLFTSAIANEGKTAVAIALARQEARAGMKVLMIDADLRQPTLHKIFRGKRNGLAELLQGEKNFESLVQHDEAGGIDYLAGGFCSSSPVDLLGSATMRKFLERVEQEYGRVIIDCAPILAAADARVLTTLVGPTMYLVRWGSTPRSIARTGFDVLRQSGGRVLGPIFLDVDVELAPYSMVPQWTRLQA